MVCVRDVGAAECVCALRRLWPGVHSVWCVRVAMEAAVRSTARHAASLGVGRLVMEVACLVTVRACCVGVSTVVCV